MATSSGRAHGHMDGHKGGARGPRVTGKTGTKSGTGKKPKNYDAKGHHSKLFGSKKNTKETKKVTVRGL
jgi:hypothetical protein